MTTQEMQSAILKKLYEETLLAVAECQTHKDARDILNATANTFAFSLPKMEHGD